MNIIANKQNHRLKVQLKLGINRLKLLQSKKNSINQAARKEISNLLATGKEESARIRVEHIIREDYNIEALEILEIYCELLLARFGLLEQGNQCDQAISEAVNSIIYATPRTDVKELGVVRDILISKFGKEFGAAAMENRNDVVNSRIIHKLKVQTPDPLLVYQYLKEIAKSYNIEWDGDVSFADVLGLESKPTPGGDEAEGTKLSDLEAKLKMAPSMTQPPPTISQPSPLQPRYMGDSANVRRGDGQPGYGDPANNARRDNGQPGYGDPRFSSGQSGPSSQPAYGGGDNAFYGNSQQAPPNNVNHIQPLYPSNTGPSTSQPPPNYQDSVPQVDFDFSRVRRQEKLPPNENGNGRQFPDFPGVPRRKEDDSSAPPDDDTPDFDELARRFEALKRK